MTSMIYRIKHITRYEYATNVQISHNQVMLMPKNLPGSSTLKHRLKVETDGVDAMPALRKRDDYFANVVHSFSLERSHKSMSVTSFGQVEVFPREIKSGDASPPWEEIISSVQTTTDPRWLEATQFRFPSSRIRTDETFRNYALESFTAERPVLESAFELTQRIFSDFEYDPDATHVNTPTAESFDLRRGVCQDFAHIEIACLRSLGLSAKYVSGYLRTLPPPGKPRLVGADQSHAWLAVYCGPKLGWVDLDPTNNCLTGEGHITIAHGRDYEDVVPIRGVFLGGGKHKISVSVDVAPQT